MTSNLKLTTTGPTPSSNSSGSVGSLEDRLKAKTAEQTGAIQTLTESELQKHQQNLSALSQRALDSTSSVIDHQLNQIKQTMLGTESAVKNALSQTAEQLSKQTEGISKQLTTQTEAISTALDSKKSQIEQTLNQSRQTLEQASEQVKTSASKAISLVQKSLGQTTQLVSQQQTALHQAINQQTKQLLWLMKVPVLILVAVCLAVCAGTWAWTQHRMNQAYQYEQEAAQRLRMTHQTINTLTQQFCQTPAGRASCKPSNQS